MKINWETFKQEMIAKIDNGEKLSEEELKRFKDFSIEDIEGDEHRWTIDTQSIIEHDGRFFVVNWQRGLTESCEHMFHYQPYEAIRTTKEKTITVVSYKPKNKM